MYRHSNLFCRNESDQKSFRILSFGANVINKKGLLSKETACKNFPTTNTPAYSAGASVIKII
jgi:hypothetical protein